MSRLLVLEDDIQLQQALKDMLEIKGYDVIVAGSMAQYKKLKDKFDLYLLDVLLPDGTGFDVCREIRQTSDACIIFITSCDDQESIVKGLDMGGDDYITKPFYSAELMSRIQANLRRSDRGSTITGNSVNSGGSKGNGSAGNILVSGTAAGDRQDIYIREGLTVYLQEYRVVREGTEINLTTTEFEILKLLIANRGRIVKRQLLFEKIWDKTGKFVEDNTLTVAISRLKSKLGTYGAEHRSYIENIRNVGYRWREV